MVGEKGALWAGFPSHLKNGDKVAAFPQLAKPKRWWRQGQYDRDPCRSGRMVCKPLDASPVDVRFHGTENVHARSAKCITQPVRLPKKLNTHINVDSSPPPPLL